MNGRSDGSVIIDINGRSDNFNTALSGAKKAAATAGKAIIASLEAVGAAIGAISAGVVAVGTKIVNEYANYEQLVGGVETLFGAQGKSLEEYAASVGKTVTEASAEYSKLLAAQETVMKNAENAYKTAGMSANDYMETVTSFSASLIQSLGGDTQKAAEYADMAITDMSDNANKMGTDMEMIQNAYNGFAKQNYTMLDNLKIGYGGTKEEMERLLADAEKLSGIEYDISSYADIVDAIHVIQTEMGITGTTAAEAEKTISGSINTLKAAFDNLLAGLGNAEADVQGLIDNVAAAFDNVVKNISPVVDNIIAALPSAFAKISDAIGELLPSLLTTVTGSASEIILTLADGIADNIDVIISAATTIFETFVSTAQALIPTLQDVAVELVGGLCNFVTNNISDVVQLGLDMINAVCEGIAEALPLLIPAATNAVIQIVNTLTDANNIEKVVQSALNIILALVDGLTSAQTVTEFVKMAPVVIGNIVSALVQVLSDIFDFGVKVAYEIARGISEFDFESAISDVYTELYNIGAKLHQSLTDGYNGDANMAGLVEQYGDKTEKELRTLAANIVTEQEKLQNAWEDCQKHNEMSIDEYIEANKDNINGITLNTIKQEAAKEGITGANLGTYIKEKIEELNAENADILLAISNGIYKTTTLNADAQKSVMDGYAANARNASQAVGNSTASINASLSTTSSAAEDTGSAFTAMAENTSQSADDAGKSLDNLSAKSSKAAAKISDDFKSFYDDLNLARAKGEISDDEYIARLKKKLESSAEYDNPVYTKYWKEVTSAETKAAEAAAKEEEKAEKERQEKLEALQKEFEQKREQAAKERLKQQQETANAELAQFKSDTDKLTSEYKSRLSELQSERDSFQNKLSENIFKTETVTDSRTGETKTVGGTVNLQKKIAARKELGKYLESLVKKGIPKGMLSELAAMDPSEGLQFAKQLDGMKGDKWQSLVADYNDYEAVNKQIADQVYGPQITALNQQYASDMTALMDTVTDGAASAGAQTVKEFISGVDLASDDAMAQINAKIAEVNNSISEAISDGSMFEKVDTSAVGTSMMNGIAKGIISKSDVLKKAFEKAISNIDIMATLQAAVDLKASGYTPASTSTVTNNTVVNNNNTYTSAPTVQNGGSGVTNLTVNLLWKDGTKLAEIVNSANKRIAISTGG